jgi:hypothetical protein
MWPWIFSIFGAAIGGATVGFIAAALACAGKDN